MTENPDIPPVVSDHRRQWHDCLYVYPVISRRARGLSIGVNLNPDKACNFSCLYCQIDRRIRRNLHKVDMPILRNELEQALRAACEGGLWLEERFGATPPEFRRLNDIALSGDGEPTCLPNFDQAVQAAADAKHRPGCDDVKIVVITNSSQLTNPQVRRALPILDANNGEIWAKLDAGTDEYFQRINRPRPPMPLQQIVDNIIDVARGRPVVIQSLFARIDGGGPPADQIDAYCNRLAEIVAAGGGIHLVQIHTIARAPASESVAVLGNAELDAIAAKVRETIGQVPVETYYGMDSPPQSGAIRRGPE